MLSRKQVSHNTRKIINLYTLHFRNPGRREFSSKWHEILFLVKCFWYSIHHLIRAYIMCISFYKKLSTFINSGFEVEVKEIIVTVIVMSTCLPNVNISFWTALCLTVHFLDYTLYVPELNNEIQDQTFELFYKRASNIF